MQTIINRAGWLVAGVLGLFVVAAMTGVVSGGPLDPPGAPAPTQKTLDEIPGSWSRALASNDGPNTCRSSRFLCVLSDAAVLDRETGLVWERVPSVAPQSSWAAARTGCTTASTGNRKGWRLASDEEAASLLGIDITGHPFTLSSTVAYWTATTAPDNSLQARIVLSAANGGITNAGAVKTDGTKLRWCVRGGAADDGL